jgi:hypothetical protein
LVVTAIGGAPVVHFPTADGREGVELSRGQTEQREKAKEDCTIGGFWRIPDLPVVPKHLRGAQTWIRHTSTDEEILRDKPRTCALRVIPENHPDYAALFGVREDTESMHNHLMRELFNGRLRSVGLHRVRMNCHGYQMRNNIAALLAHHYRTGSDLEPWFGRWRPPNHQHATAA